MLVTNPLSDFFIAIDKDARINIRHIGVYAALLQFCSANGSLNPLEAYSYDIIQIAKISSPTTYHKCVKDLNDYGYIKYEPSFKRNSPSKVYLILKNQETPIKNLIYERRNCNKRRLGSISQPTNR